MSSELRVVCDRSKKYCNLLLQLLLRYAYNTENVKIVEKVDWVESSQDIVRGEIYAKVGFCVVGFNLSSHNS